MPFGRQDLEWDELVQAAIERLRALARDQQLTTYSALNRELADATGLGSFDLGSEGGRHAMGQMLGDATRRDYPTSKVLLSALCTHRDGVDVGQGFYSLAKELGLLPAKSSADAKELFWITTVQEAYASRGRPSPHHPPKET